MRRLRSSLLGISQTAFRPYCALPPEATQQPQQKELCKEQAALLDQGEAYVKQYYLPEAFAALHQARRCDGADPNHQRQLSLDAVLFIKQNKGNLAAEASIKLLQQNPSLANDPIGLANLGTVFSVNKDYARARIVLERVPRGSDVYREQAGPWLGEALAILGEDDEAVDVMEDVCEMDEDPQETLKRFTSSDAGVRSLRVKNMQLFGLSLLNANQAERAIDVLERGVLEAKVLLGEQDVITCGIKTALGMAYTIGSAATRRDDAIAIFDEALPLLEDRHVEGDPLVLKGLRVLAELHMLQLRSKIDAEGLDNEEDEMGTATDAKKTKDTHFAFRDKCLDAYDRVIKMGQKVFPSQDVQSNNCYEISMALLAKARVLMLCEQHAEAIPLLDLAGKNVAFSTVVPDLIDECTSCISERHNEEKRRKELLGKKKMKGGGSEMVELDGAGANNRID